MVDFNAAIRTDLVSASDDVRGFGYHAAEDKGRRRAPPSSLESEDRTLGTTGRKRVTSGGRDVLRNFSIAAWMVRKHVDYVCEASFHARTGDDGFDTECESLIKWWSGRFNFDIGGRFGFDKYIRLAETRGLAEGDFGTLKLSTGHVQGIEGDRIQQPPSTRLAAEDGSWEWIEGVKTAALGGRALAYAIHRRGRGGRGFKFEKDVAASNLYLHGFFDRYDQTRGISPITAAMNNLKDVYENFDLALAKAKISQLLALVIQRDGTGDDDEADGQAATRRGDGGYEIDFGMGPIKIELDPGHDAKFLESTTPSNQFQDFTRLVLMVALKSLDLPYSFFDESHTNFFGSRGGWMNYDRSCIDKRRNSLEMRYHLTRWRLQLAIQDGWISLPKSKSKPYNLGNLPIEWVPTGMPWWDPAKEITGELKAIGAGLDNPQRICKEKGRGDYYENIDLIAEAQEYAKKKGVNLSFAPGPDPMQIEVNHVETDE